MKTKKTIILFAMILVFSLSLAACSPYKSSFVATMMVTTDLSDHASLEFWKMKGTKVFTLNSKSDDTELVWSGKVKEGSVTVYYDDDGTKKELFTVTGNEEKSSSVDVSKGKTYIIIETDGECETGAFSFYLE